MSRLRLVPFSLEHIRLSFESVRIYSSVGCVLSAGTATFSFLVCSPSASATSIFLMSMADLTTKEKPSALENGSEESDHGDKASTIFQNTDDTDLPDPDEGKSPEERAKLVCGNTRHWESHR